VHPARGHLVFVSNPGLRTSVRDEDNPAGLTYVHPRSLDVVLGGTFEPGAWDCTPTASIGQELVEPCTALIPELRGARVLKQVVGGLRPVRHGGVRVALDPAGLPGGVRLIHDYGHGGAGVTLGWGCADEVVNLARTSLTS
jgi:D-amino-acid oxidase